MRLPSAEVTTLNPPRNWSVTEPSEFSVVSSPVSLTLSAAPLATTSQPVPKGATSEGLPSTGTGSLPGDSIEPPLSTAISAAVPSGASVVSSALTGPVGSGASLELELGLELEREAGSGAASSPPSLTADMPTGIATATRTAATAPATAIWRPRMRITSSSLLGGQAPSTQILPSGVIGRG